MFLLNWDAFSITYYVDFQPLTTFLYTIGKSKTTRVGNPVHLRISRHYVRSRNIKWNWTSFKLSLMIPDIKLWLNLIVEKNRIRERLESEEQRSFFSNRTVHHILMSNVFVSKPKLLFPFPPTHHPSRHFISYVIWLHLHIEMLLGGSWKRKSMKIRGVEEKVFAILLFFEIFLKYHINS